LKCIIIYIYFRKDSQVFDTKSLTFTNTQLKLQIESLNIELNENIRWYTLLLNEIFNLIIYLFSKMNAANLSNINLQLQVKNLKE
jgi:hypothetical protein